MSSVNIAVTGVSGRMGRTLIQAVDLDPDVTLSAAVQRQNGSLLGVDAGDLAGVTKTGVLVTAELEQADYDVMVDFTLVQPCLNHLESAQKMRKAVVIGTTGFSEVQKEHIQEVAKTIPIVLAPNTSVGITLCLHLLQQMAPILAEDSDIEIIETHHRHKIDSPSGTALRLGEVIAESLGRDLTECAVYGRQGVEEPRKRSTIGFSTVRGGDVVGDHTVLFASEGERLELTHKASSRMTFAKGAIRAAKWVSKQEPGLYDMRDVLGL